MAAPLFVPHIARKLRRLHAVPTDGRPTLWQTLMAWFQLASELSFEDKHKQEQIEKIDFQAMKEEIEATHAICDLVNSPVVFSHNDLLAGNILIVEQTEGRDGDQDGALAALGGALKFIDYEYSDCGYRGFDFGNHFNEYAGFECDYTRYPDSEAQRLFFRSYLAGSTSSELPAAADGAASSCAASDEELQKLEAEANVFALVSHMYWGLWALIQARHSPIDFDYLQFSAGRWREYHRRKDEFLLQAKKTFGL